MRAIASVTALEHAYITVRELASMVYATYWKTAYSGPQLRIRMQLVRLKSRYVKAVGVSAYCVLRITSWRAVLKAACGRPAYSAPVLRIELWAVVSAACVLRIRIASVH